jgi:DNA-directed RNA polymerase specialized sigma24 family protein
MQAPVSSTEPTDPSAPPPPSPALALPGAPAEPAPREPAPELVAHLVSKELRARLVGNAKYNGIPERRQEEVVQTALAEAWRQRHTWPDTVERLEKLIFTILRFDRLDVFRDEADEPLLQEDEADGAEATAGDDPGDGDPPGVAYPEETLETRERLHKAMAYVESQPKLRQSFAWLLETLRGKSYEAIAVQANVSPKIVENALVRLRIELRKIGGAIILVAALAALATILYVLHGRVNDMATPPPRMPRTLFTPPPPTAPAPVAPSDVIPPPEGVTGPKPH